MSDAGSMVVEASRGSCLKAACGLQVDMLRLKCQRQIILANDIMVNEIPIHMYTSMSK
jgi:hypothetical protein